MSHSSGIFTFPSTGWWRVSFNALGDENNSKVKVYAEIWATFNASGADDWSLQAVGMQEALTGISGATATAPLHFYTMNSEAFVDVTSVADVKVKFRIGAQSWWSSDYQSDNVTFHGNASYNQTYMTFTRLGDT